MIRNFKICDIDEVMGIWLDVNMHTHNFIQKNYWTNNYDKVKQILPKSTVYVYEMDNKIQGFIGLIDNYIAGVFVDNNVQSKGIGKKLLDYVKQHNERLTLHVYQKNYRAVKFYQREGFVILNEQIDEDTKEAEFTMFWGQ